MTPAEQKVHDQKMREEAQNRIADIDSLKENKAFNRYFVGLLNRQRDTYVSLALRSKSQDEREKARHIAVFIEDELMQAPSVDRANAEKLLRSPVIDPTQPTRPVQVG